MAKRCLPLMVWKNSVKLHYQKKEEFYSHFNMEDIADADYMHVKKSFVEILKEKI